MFPRPPVQQYLCVSPISCVTVVCYGKYIETCHLAESREVMGNTASPRKSCQCLPEDDFSRCLCFSSSLMRNCVCGIVCVCTLCVHITQTMKLGHSCQITVLYFNSSPKQGLHLVQSLATNTYLQFNHQKKILC